MGASKDSNGVGKQSNQVFKQHQSKAGSRSRGKGFPVFTMCNSVESDGFLSRERGYKRP